MLDPKKEDTENVQNEKNAEINTKSLKGFVKISLTRSVIDNDAATQSIFIYFAAFLLLLYH